MIGIKCTWLHIIVAILNATHAAAQQCYYPNGNLAPSTEKPCSTKAGSACCPENWICLDNGLCHYPVHDLYERHSCTDESWNAPGCPSNLCTYDGQASGAESITQCTDHSDNWCCNADAQHVDCCQELPTARPFFALKAGRSYATIGVDQASYVPTLFAITGIATGAGTTGSPPTSRLPSSIRASTWSTTVSSRIATTSVSGDPQSTGLYTGSAGVRTIAISLPTSSSETSPKPSSPVSSSRKADSHKTSIIIGCIVGVVLSLILAGLLIYTRHKHLRQQAHPYTHTTDTKSSNPKTRGKHWSVRFLPELDGHPLSPRRFLTTSDRPVELDAGTELRPGALPSYGAKHFGGGDYNNQPHWGGMPPRYTPTTDWDSHNRQGISTAELDGRPVIPSVKTRALTEKRTMDGSFKI